MIYSVNHNIRQNDSILAIAYSYLFLPETYIADTNQDFVKHKSLIVPANRKF
ncbi:hypothetical protein GW923_03170 [Candidatus Pacearchaeota archaeon]|nr:hypothetical protein [Candidatus Pacearchaeota archaeon]